MLVCLLLQLRFASFSYHFICFIASGCLQMSSFTILVRRDSIITPPVRKSEFQPFVATLNPFVEKTYYRIGESRAALHNTIIIMLS